MLATGVDDLPDTTASLRRRETRASSHLEHRPVLLVPVKVCDPGVNVNGPSYRLKDRLILVNRGENVP